MPRPKLHKVRLTLHVLPAVLANIRAWARKKGCTLGEEVDTKYFLDKPKEKR